MLMLVSFGRDLWLIKQVAVNPASLKDLLLALLATSSQKKRRRDLTFPKGPLVPHICGFEGSVVDESSFLPNPNRKLWGTYFGTSGERDSRCIGSSNNHTMAMCESGGPQEYCWFRLRTSPTKGSLKNNQTTPPPPHPHGCESSPFWTMLLTPGVQSGGGSFSNTGFANTCVLDHFRTQSGSFSNTWGGYPAAPVGWGGGGVGQLRLRRNCVLGLVGR